MIGFSVCLEFSLCLFNHVYTSSWTTQCLEILDKMPHLTCCRTILYPRWEEFCKDMSGLLLWADQLWKCTGLISLRRGDVQRHNTCWYFAQVVQTHGHALQSGKNSKEKHGSCSIWNFRCWQEDMIGTIYSAISWNFSGTITKEEKKKKKEKWTHLSTSCSLKPFSFAIATCGANTIQIQWSTLVILLLWVLSEFP